MRNILSVVILSLVLQTGCAQKSADGVGSSTEGTPKGVANAVPAVDMSKVLACLSTDLPRKPIHVIRTQAQLQKLVGAHGKRCSIKMPLMGFPQKMLIGTVVRTGGCSVAVDAKVVKRKNSIVLKIVAKSYGACEMMALVPVWKLIAAVPPGTAVRSQIQLKNLPLRQPRKSPSP